MRRLLYCDCVGNIGSVGVLLLRVVMGAAFILHGWPKIQNPMSWMPGDEAPPGGLQALAAVSEFCGGAALIVGFLTRLASLGLGATMVGAVMFHMQQEHPFVAPPPGGPSYELAAVYLACSVLFFLIGPGRWSLDAGMFGRRATP